MEEAFGISDKLNKIIGSKSSKSLTFYEGNIAQVIEVLNTVAPYNKVAMVYTKNAFERYCDLATVLPQMGFQITNIIEDNEIIDFSKSSELLKCSSNFKAVVSIGSGTFAPVSYYCSLRKIPAIYYVDSFDMLGALETRTSVKINGKADYVLTLPERHIVLDIEKILKDRENISKAYGWTENMLVALIDYRIAGLVGNNILDTTLYSILKKAVLSCYYVFKYDVYGQANIVLSAYLLAHTVNIMSGGELTDYSSVKLSAFLLGDSNAIYNPEIAKRILGLYELCFSGKYINPLAMRDYLADDIKLQEKLNTENINILKSIKRNAQTFCDNEKLFIEIEQKLYEEIASLSKASKTIYNTYLALKGNAKIEKLKLNNAIALSGFIPKAFNGMTLVKESGILD